MKYFIIMIIVVYTNSMYSQPDNSNFWKLTNGPYGQKITSINPLGNDSIVVGTDGAGIFLYTKSDSTWKSLFSDNRFNDIYSSIITNNKSILFSLKANAPYFPQILKFSRDLTYWNLNEVGAIGKFANINDSSENFIMYITQWNGIFKSVNDGNTWQTMNVETDLFDKGLKDIEYDTKLSRIILATNSAIYDGALSKDNLESNGILISDDFGTTYYNVLKGNFDNVIIGHKDIMFAIGESRIQHRSFDGGSTWEYLDYVEEYIFQDIVLISDSLLYSVNRKGIYLSHDYGNTWIEKNTELKDLITLYPIDSSSIYLGGTNGLFHYSVLTNKTTNLTNGLFASNIYAIHNAKDGKIYAGGKNGIVYYSDNPSINWESTYPLEIEEYRFIKNVNTFTETTSNRIFVGTDLPFFYFSDDILGPWNRVLNEYFVGSPEIWALAVNSRDEIYVGTSNEGIVVINDDASEFTTTPILGQSILCLDIDENDDVYAGSLYGTVFFTTNNGTEWHANSNGLNYYPVISIKKDEKLITSTIKSVFRYDENNGLFENIGLNLPANISISGMIKIGNTIIISSRTHGVFYTNNEGENWNEFNTGLLNTNITAIVNDNNNYLYAASNQGIYKTNDKVVKVKIINTKDIPSEVILYNNYPNPFNSQTIINFYNPITQNICVKIYSILGEEIKILTNDKYLTGESSLFWDGTNNNNLLVNSGIYFVVLFTNDKTISNKIIFMK